MQNLVKSPASFIVHSPFGISFILSHHFSLPISAEQAEIIVVNDKMIVTRLSFLISDIGIPSVYLNMWFVSSFSTQVRLQGL